MHPPNPPVNKMRVSIIISGKDMHNSIFLEKRGIDAGSIENMGKASMLIDRLMNRQKEGLSTPKQIRLLERYGFRFVGTWSFDAASKVISRLAALNWKLPCGFNPATYVPS